jgi:hypothetical protein
VKYLKAFWRALSSPIWLLWYGGFCASNLIEQIADYPNSPRNWLTWLNLVTTLLIAVWFTWDARRELRQRKAAA